MTAVTAICLAAGYFIGHMVSGMQLLAKADDAIAVLLYAMLFFVGMQLGMKKGLRKDLKRMGLDAVALPALVAAGSIAGGWLAALPLQLHGWKGAAVGAGFGWYSLSSVMLAGHDPALAAVAFLSNIIREVLALLFIPILCKYIHPWAGIAAGGATAMDTTLPAVVRASGSDFAIQSFASGVILSILAPIAISAILSFAGVK